MELGGQQPFIDRKIAVGTAFEANAEIGEARDIARSFLVSVQAVHALPVSAQAMGAVQLVVSELVTNVRKHAPGPCLLDLEISQGAVQISVWDSSTSLPSVQAADPERIGHHGLEIAMAVSQTFCVHREPVGKRITTSVVLADHPSGSGAGPGPCDL
ncbi:ATP-binding protein [Streptomyces sp. SID14478]|uniref:ATP-binding protein n=1 Tax=Streptomyces sp. SID14478 TaxID=2706073 RepID=UPI0013DD0AB9|nr:ATP-binding protein [Streptomyces sp. SID14478]NEB77436.1 ATP-binding protein [Streptomyces sp. SID14478]